MKKIRLRAVPPFVFLLFCSSVGAQEMEDMFDVSENFEEPNMDIKIARNRKPKLSIKDLPFYTKVFCSYVYEEKLQVWYRAAVGYVSVAPKKKKHR